MFCDGNVYFFFGGGIGNLHFVQKLRETESLVERGVEEIPFVVNATLSLAHTKRQRYAAHARQLRANHKSNQKAAQVDICNVFVTDFTQWAMHHVHLQLHFPRRVTDILLPAAKAADMADIWLCITRYNKLFLGQPQAALWYGLV